MPQTSTDSFGNLWLDSAAAAIILCPVMDLPKWQGIDGPYYDQACVNDSPWLFRLPTPDGLFLSLWCERTSVAWKPAADFSEGIIWRWMMGPYKTEIIAPPLPGNVVEIEKPMILDSAESKFLLFDSIDVGAEAEAVSIPIALSCPLKQIRTYEYRPNPETWLVLHHLTT